MKSTQLTEFLYRNAELLDQERFDDWLAQCAENFHYRITTFSDELGRQMDWMDKDKAGMTQVLTNANKHERYTGRLRRHLSMPRIDVEPGGQGLHVSTALATYHTEVNGVTSLYAIGSYIDEIREIDGRFALASRVVQLDTRRLAFGPHVPL
ncbi:MAG: hypothetical protein J0H09_12715 [Burkholderiales bacterium]|nr:hypothetical protein [Burkholderiales bacterium]